MPDTGDFDRQNAPQGATLAWGAAFAALPQEAPDAGGWQRVQARLPAPAPRARVRWPLLPVAWIASRTCCSSFLPRTAAKATKLN